MINRKNVYNYILSTVLVFILIYFPSYYIPVHSDDYMYFLKGLSLEAHLRHYLNWSGRFITDYISSLLLNLFSKPIYMAINSLAFLTMLINISFIPSLLNGEELITKKSCIFLWLSFFIYWLCNPNLGQTSFWLVGSANYLWPLMWLSFYMVYLFKLFKDSITKTAYNAGYKQIIILCILGFCSGSSNEATGVATVFLTFVLCLMKYSDKVKNELMKNCSIVNSSFIFHSCDKTLYASLFSSLIGCLTLILAPGNYIRMTTTVFAPWRSLSLSNKVLLHIMGRMPEVIVQFRFAFIIIAILLLFLLWNIQIKSNEFKKLVSNVGIIVLSFLAILVFSLDIIQHYDCLIMISLFLIVALLVIFVSLINVYRKSNILSLSLLKNYVSAGIFFITAVFSIFVFIVSPHMPPRALNTFNFFIVLTIVMLMAEHLSQSDKNKKKLYCIGLIFMLCVPCFLFSYTRFTYAMIQTDVQAKIRNEIVLRAKAQGYSEVSIPDWYFTKLLKESDKFDLWRSDSMPEYYGIKKIVWEPADFNYAILKTKKPVVFTSQLNNNLSLRMFYNNSNIYFDEPSLVFEFERPLNLFDKKNAVIEFNFYLNNQNQFVSIDKKTEDFCKIGNFYYYVVKLNDIDFQTIKKMELVLKSGTYRELLKSFTIGLEK